MVKEITWTVWEYDVNGNDRWLGTTTGETKYEAEQNFKKEKPQHKDKVLVLKKKFNRDDDATEHGSVEQYGKKLKSSTMKLSKNPVQANDGASSKDADESWITMKGAHVKIDGGESKREAAKKFIKKKGGDPAPAKGKAETSSEAPKYDEEEIRGIKEKWKGKEIKGGYGSEYGDILNHLKKENGIIKETDKYWEMRDKLTDMREQGKRNTEEYAKAEKELKDFNKSFNKKYKALEQKAYEFSSEGEKARLREISPNQYKDSKPTKVMDDINYTPQQLQEVSWTTLPYIINNPHRYTKETLAMAKKMMSKDSDPKVAEANALINLCGGVM